MKTLDDILKMILWKYSGRPTGSGLDDIEQYIIADAKKEVFELLPDEKKISGDKERVFTADDMNETYNKAIKDIKKRFKNTKGGVC